MATAQELESKRVWSIDDLCAYTGMKKGTVYNLTSKRLIPHSKPTGSRVFFDRDEIIKWLLHGEVSTIDSIASKAAAGIPMH